MLFGGKKEKSAAQKASENKAAVKEWLPFDNIINGIVCLKNGDYVRIIEVIPINFKLKSKKEKKTIIINYRSFLKACKFPLQLSIQCKKADITKYVQRMEDYYKNEKTESVRYMINGHINLVKSLGSKGAVSRRFFMVIPYILPAGVKKVKFQDVEKQLSEKLSLVKEHLKKCGNSVVDTCNTGNTEFTANILYTYLNKKTCELQRFGGRLLNFVGLINETREDIYV